MGNKYLIVSQWQNKVYCYMESENHHVICEEQRIKEGRTRLPFSKLADECEITQYPKDTYFVLELQDSEVLDFPHQNFNFDGAA